MANHNKNKKFRNDNFERFNKARPVGQDSFERDSDRKSNQIRQRRSVEDEDFYSSYEDHD